jgi:GT2 family glycosyltransferase/ubiquinone/menaquinone biosynthesis C-methylase UbiE/glycosyltransferase involved in cell wall biosynthesis
MKFTGERYIPTEQGKIRLEHYHRYTITLDAVKEKDVLDVACGEGYGSFLMADVARSVAGVDISNEVIDHASATYKKPNLVFYQGSAINLNFADASFDVVVSFETIEHLAEQTQMLAEIKRVLRPDGLLVISSPNRPIYSEESGEHNEFHVKELDFNEFDELLKTQFSNIQYFGQRMLMGSVIQALEGGQSSFRVWHDDGNDLKPNSGHLTEPVYFVALCRTGNVDLPNIDMSFLYPDKLDLIKHYVGFAKWAQTLDGVIAMRDAQVIDLNAQIVERDTQIADRDTQIADRDTQIADRDTQIADRDTQIADRDTRIAKLKTQINGQVADLSAQIAEYDAKNSILSIEIERVSLWGKYLQELLDKRDEQITHLSHAVVERDQRIADMSNSSSWRITRPLRGSKRFTKFIIKRCLQLTRHIYQSLPLSNQTKVAHRNTLANYFPRLLLVSGSQITTIPVSEQLNNQPTHECLSESHSITIPNLTPPILEREILESFDSFADFAKTIHLSVSDAPLVSVIIPVYGKIEYTLYCLASIASNPPQASFEVIVIDDCSPDNSVEVLDNIQGIHLIQNKQNQGFIRSCNAGAKAAQGEYLYFLNNDTEVTQGWMDELLRTFQEFPGTGLTGSKLIYPDGRLQEAGGIIWQDGSAWNFGHSQDPLLPVYNYAREVDYCSGASIMVPKTLFDGLGGFDEYYLPAYCEDSDLALKIRDKGYRVIYQPMSTVIHYEGITSGTDTSQGTKAYQIANTKKLYERWKDRLRTHQLPGMDVDNAKDRRATYRVLVLDHCTPTPDQDAGSVTVFNSMLLLREMGFQVTFIPENNFLYLPDYTTALQRSGIEVLYLPYVTSIEQHLEERGDRYDLVFLFRPDVIKCHLETIHKFCHKAKVLYHTVDLHFLRMSREAELQSDEAKQKAADEMKQKELSVIRASDASIVHSTAELELLQPELPDAKLHVFPLIMNVHGTNKTFSDRQDIVFVGGYQHTPNVDAVQYFVLDIMPLIRQRLPNVRFYAIGSKVPDEIQALASKDVIITGFVEDLVPLLDKMRISVAPLRYGAGIKGKIGSAMAVGLPVVATPLAAEGMSLTDGENILVADGAEAFADAIVKLYQDESLWNRLSQNGLVFADQAWGAKAAYGILTQIVSNLGIKPVNTSYPLSLYSELNKVKNNLQTLEPIASAKNRAEFEHALQHNTIKQISSIEQQLVKSSQSTKAFTVDGYCVPCNKKVALLVDMQSGGQQQNDGWLPNWRERLECPSCGMNNRQRLIATLVNQTLSGKQGQHVYFMEQVTPIYQWAINTFKNDVINGSEYLGHQYESGAIIESIRHEDIENLSFSNESLDLIVSNDVFEHVPTPAKAFAECARALKAGGIMLATIPFYSNRDESVTRAKFVNGQLEHILPPAYHGNPVSAEGALVFTDFGWDMVETMQKAGFSNVCVEVYASVEYGHLGGGQLIFRAIKSKKQISDTSDAMNEEYTRKIQQELTIFENRANVHDLPNIYHYWSNKYLFPLLEEAGYSAIDDFFSSNLLVAKNRTGSSIARFVSIGAGNCDMEVSIAKNLINAGCRTFILECLEINPAMLERGKEIARENGVIDNMRFVEADFNTWVANDKYDGVMANQSLHHVTELEHLFDQINSALQANGSFVINDIIGRNGHQYWPEALEIVNQFWKELPENYKFNVILNRLEEEYDNWDCSTEGFEGIRAQDILPLLLRQFQCEKFVTFGNLINVFVDRCFGHHFNPESEWDRDFIDRVHAEDVTGFKNGTLTPTHMLAVFVKTLNYTPYYANGIDPVSAVRKP